MNKEKDLVEASMKIWEQHGGWKLVHTELPHSVIGKMFHSSVKRVEVSCPTEAMVQRNPQEHLLEGQYLRPAHMWIKVKNIMMQDGAVEMAGIAPAGDLERKVQQYLDEMDPPK